MKTAEQLWAEFCAFTPSQEQMTPKQRRTIRMSFYGGILAMFANIPQMTPDGMKLLRDELDAFAAELTNFD